MEWTGKFWFGQACPFKEWSERAIIEAAIAKSGQKQSVWLRKALLYVAQNNIVLT